MTEDPYPLRDAAHGESGWWIIPGAIAGTVLCGACWALMWAPMFARLAR